MQLEHDDKKAREKVFSEMVDLVSKYMESGRPRYQREALGKISVSMIGADSQMVDELSRLYSAVFAGYARTDIQQLLNSVICLKNAPAEDKNCH